MGTYDWILKNPVVPPIPSLSSFGVIVFQLFYTKSLQKTKNLMKKYADLPMDFAVATIVCLATEARIQNVITFDRKDFSIYKLPKKQSFAIMP